VLADKDQVGEPYLVSVRNTVVGNGVATIEELQTMLHARRRYVSKNKQPKRVVYEIHSPEVERSKRGQPL
jgi:hypothetical protein